MKNEKDKPGQQGDGNKQGGNKGGNQQGGGKQGDKSQGGGGKKSDQEDQDMGTSALPNGENEAVAEKYKPENQNTRRGNNL